MTESKQEGKKRRPVLRPSVRLFAEHMERRLKRHDADRGKRGWKGHGLYSLADRIRDELKELEATRAAADARDEAADIGNFAMMIFDNENGNADE